MTESLGGEPMAVCVECRFFVRRRLHSPHYSAGSCSSPANREFNPIHGFLWPEVDRARDDEKLCGAAGRHFIKSQGVFDALRSLMLKPVRAARRLAEERSR